MTYFNADYGLTLRHPASWKTEQAEQEGMWYRYFLGPPQGPERKPAVSATLLAGPLGGSLEDYAQTYLAGNGVLGSREETRQGARGKSYSFASPDGRTRYSLLLLQEGSRVYGLFAQGDTEHFKGHTATLDEMSRSLTLERPASYTLYRNDRYGFSLRTPPSWRATRNFSGGGTFVMQFTSPALAADQSRQTVHASLTVTVEPVSGDGGLETFYKATRDKQGEAFQVLNHAAWNGGYVDVLRTETPMAVSRVKRFYRAANGRGYALAFEARDDVYHRVSRWCDMIAATWKTGTEAAQP